jgi:hypothetical protein
MHTLGFWLWHHLCSARLNLYLDCFWDIIQALLFYWLSHKQQKSPIMMCLAQSDHPWQCWKDLLLVEDLNLCESIACGAFPPFSNPPTSHPPPNILSTPNPSPISWLTILRHILSGEAPLGSCINKILLTPTLQRMAANHTTFAAKVHNSTTARVF